LKKFAIMVQTWGIARIQLPKPII